MKRIITFTTDFGLKDSYSGAMKGVVLSINPGAVTVDVSHMVSPGNITEGALVLLSSCSFFPGGTVHVGVVDPGVGGKRRPILVETDRYLFVGPDNGLLMPAARRDGIKRVVHLTEKRYFLKEISATFHGRDVFAPVAAHLTLGADPGSFGEIIEDPVELNIPSPDCTPGLITGEVLYVDAFGNLITNIRREEIRENMGAGRVEVVIKGRVIVGLYETYSMVERGSLVGVVGSLGMLEVAANADSAAELLGAGVGDEVGVRARR
ncbi:MAG TPA: SAM-dependent chlorinase/fluorinase [Thermodesulfobacteriota bacterium]|nr:SAM-dependent chlorinase/fluorinase [Thermodesulfobacteriota bacterium]